VGTSIGKALDLQQRTPEHGLRWSYAGDETDNSRRSSTAGPIQIMGELPGHIMHLHCIALILAFSLNTFSGLAANAETSIQVATPILLSNGSEADIEAIRELIRNVEGVEADDAPSISLKLQFVSEQIFPEILGACGHEKNFEEFFLNHKFLPYLLDEAEQNFLAKCMYGIFKFADETLGFSAPGLYKRFDDAYIHAGVQLGYRCGYRSQRSFAYFALSIWLVHHQDINSDFRFRCLGDIRPTHAYSEDSLLFGVKRISDMRLYYYHVFGSWADAQRYVLYENFRSEQRRIAVCEELFADPYDDHELQTSLLVSNQCSQPANIDTWRRWHE
jgi:hypothetical protein